MEKRAERLNSLLVQLFNDILHIEEKVLKSSEIKDLSIQRYHERKRVLFKTLLLNCHCYYFRNRV